MATPKQIAANRRNAQKSCGPKSAETKAKVSQNPLQHGLCAQPHNALGARCADQLTTRFRVLDEVEKQEKFDAFLKQLMEDEQPVGQAEIELVVKMAEHTWLSKRALRLQNNCFALEPKTPAQAKSGEIPVSVDVQHLERYVRYHAAHDRAYQRASTELQKRKKTRQLAEIGVALQQRAQAAESRQAEKHEVLTAIANVRKQREEMKLANDLAELLPPDFDISSLNQAFSAAAPHLAPPLPNRD